MEGGVQSYFSTNLVSTDLVSTGGCGLEPPWIIRHDCKQFCFLISMQTPSQESRAS